MKKIYLSLFAAATLFVSTADVAAQCSGNRFRDFVFTQDSVISNVTYGSNVSQTNANVTLKLDVHMPAGDNVPMRPLIIMAHGGNFLGGSKTGGDVLQLCHDLSLMGYVVASIDYRVGMTNFPFPGPDSSDATEAVLRASHDGKAAIRFFYKDVITNNNSYRIDTNQIYFAGVSAGGFIALNMAYLDQMSEFPTWADTTGQYGLHGGLEGLSGNPGYSSRVKAVINMCGALGDSAWIDAGSPPACLLHGDADGTVPYGSAIITLLGVYPLLQVDGSFPVAARLNQMGIENCFETYEGQDHVPHVGNAAYYDTTLNVMRNFLVHYVCNDPLNCLYNNPIGMQELPQMASLISVFPNPSNTIMNIDLSRLAQLPQRVQVIDFTGRVVAEEGTTNRVTLDVAAYPAGMYMVRVIGDNYVYSKPVIVAH